MDNSLISQAIERLNQMARLNVQTSWRSCSSDDTDVSTIRTTDFLNWSIPEINPKGHIAIPAGGHVLWLAQRFVIPQDLQGYPLKGLALRLVLTWWAKDAKIFVNGSLLQEGDLFDASTRVLLSPCVTPGEEIIVVLRLVSPDHDAGALMRSLCVYESTTDNQLDPGFVADELAILQCYLETFAPEKLDPMTAAVAEIDWEALPESQTFLLSLLSLRQNLTEAIHELPRQQRRMLLLGHSHLDLAWLWPIDETWEVAERTFASVLKLQQEFPNLTYCHSSPALYAWIEQHRPDLFAAIQQQIAQQRWEVVAGMWVEPDLNLINGESIVRQILYGQRYVQEKFGSLSTVVWLPDSFGFCATLPQMLKLGGIEYFVTQKLSWNDTTKFPDEIFWWRSPDGTQILSLMSAPIGEGIDPIKMTNYAIEWEKKTGLKDALWIFGCGDHGGGPTADMLNVANRWQQSPFFPRQEFTTASAYLQQMSNQQFPVWNDELYLEFHRGCYTTHAHQKRWNRHCEGLLYQAELFASLATLSAEEAYPKAKLSDAWKKVLFNQFHDILPGTSIPSVYVDANQAWQEVEQVGSEILERSKRAIASQIAFPAPPQPDALPIIVFNSLNWQRSEVVSVSLPTPPAFWEIYDLEGHQIPSQITETSGLLFLANDIPSVGYRVFWLCRQQKAKPEPTISSSEFDQKETEKDHPYLSLLESDSTKDWILENEFLRVIVDCKSGEFCSIFDKVYQREIVNQERCNQLQAFQDSGQYWDAWNIDPNYAKHPLPPTHLKSIHLVEPGPVQQRLRVVRQLGKSEFCQDYILSVGSPVLKIVTTVNWQERHVLVKAAFPLNLKADNATYEIPCGAIQRPTQPKEPREQAKWEVPALRWADLTAEVGHGVSDLPRNSQSSDQYGVSLLNDCKYGYDSQANQLRLTLLRSPIWPDPEADQGDHEFTYALYPHVGTWQSAHTVRRSYELNLPLQVMICPTQEATKKAPLPPVARLLDLSAQNLVLMAFKQSEDDPQRWILRCYECHGEPSELLFHSDLGLAVKHPVDILERLNQTPEPLLEEKTFSVLPWKILNLSMKAGGRGQEAGGKLPSV